jgi:catechol 2,3-dioxygenase-like lactoylglutathione lyase family enzyme
MPAKTTTHEAATTCSHITLSVSDLDRSVDFYTRVLGLSLVKDARRTGSSVWLGRAGSSSSAPSLGLILSTGVVVTPIDHLGFNCSSDAELEGLVGRAEKAGALLRSPGARGVEGDRWMLVSDPDGHRLLFTVAPQAKAAAASRSEGRRRGTSVTARLGIWLSLLVGVGGLSLLIGERTELVQQNLSGRTGAAALVLLAVTGLFWAMLWMARSQSVTERPRALRWLSGVWVAGFCLPTLAMALMVTGVVRLPERHHPRLGSSAQVVRQLVAQLDSSLVGR